MPLCGYATPAAANEPRHLAVGAGWLRARRLFVRAGKARRRQRTSPGPAAGVWPASGSPPRAVGARAGCLCAPVARGALSGAQLFSLHALR